MLQESPAVARLMAASAEARPVAPAHARFGVLLDKVEPGFCVARMRYGPVLTDTTGRLDVGSLLVVADAVLGIAVGSALPVGRRITTLHIRVSTGCTAPPAVGDVRACARLRHLDAHTGLSSGTIVDAAGALLARVSSRCAVLDGESRIAKDPSLVLDAVPTGVARVLDVEVEWLDAGGCSLRAPAAAGLGNTGGVVQGGALAAVAEHALSRALATASPALARADGQDLELIYLRGVPADGRRVLCRATIQHAGRRFGVARAEVTDADGRIALVATASRYVGS